MSAEPNYTFGFNAHHVAAALNAAKIHVGGAPPLTWQAMNKMSMFTALYGGNVQPSASYSDPGEMSVYCKSLLSKYDFDPGFEISVRRLFIASVIQPGFVVSIAELLTASLQKVAPEITAPTDPALSAQAGMHRTVHFLRRVAAACTEHGKEIAAVAQAMQRQRFAELVMVTKSDYMRHAGIDPAQLEG